MKSLNILRIKNIFFIDPVITLCTFALCVIGLLVVFSTTYFLNKGPSSFFYNQLVFYSVGFLILFLLASINYQNFINKKIFYIILFGTISLLILVLFFGELNFGARRWFDLGLLTFQPSEFAKLSVIFITSLLLSNKIIKSLKIGKYSFNRKLTAYLISFVFVVINCGLIFLQNSLGISLIIFLIYLAIAYSSIDIGINTVILGLISVLSLVLGVFLISGSFDLNTIILIILILGLSLYTLKKQISLFFLLILVIVPVLIPLSAQFTYTNLLQDYQKTRIDAFLTNDDELNLSIKWNEQQAITAVGSGLLFGKGFLKGTQSNIGYLPFAHTDFAFAAYSEQFGLIGSMVMYILYFTLIIRILYIGSRSESSIGKYLCYGIVGLIFFNTVQHIGMNLGLLPITGVPLPLVSYGGSSNIVIFIALGLILSIKSQSFRNRIRLVDNSQLDQR